MTKKERDRLYERAEKRGDKPATVVAFGIAKQRLRGVKASRDMQYDLDRRL